MPPVSAGIQSLFPCRQARRLVALSAVIKALAAFIKSMVILLIWVCVKLYLHYNTDRQSILNVY
jgi:hypothetical protein